jgi:hypothetical protein
MADRRVDWQIGDLDDSTRCRATGDGPMANVRQIAFSLVVLTAFVLVVAAPFRW